MTLWHRYVDRWGYYYPINLFILCYRNLAWQWNILLKHDQYWGRQGGKKRRSQKRQFNHVSFLIYSFSLKIWNFSLNWTINLKHKKKKVKGFFPLRSGIKGYEMFLYVLQHELTIQNNVWHRVLIWQSDLLWTNIYRFEKFYFHSNKISLPFLQISPS